jgi:hypothetical protein
MERDFFKRVINKKKAAKSSLLGGVMYQLNTSRE